MGNNYKKPRGWRRIEELAQNAAFNKDVDSMRIHNDFQRIVSIPCLMSKYDIPSNMYFVVENFANNGIVDLSLASKYVKIDTSSDGIRLQLSYDINQGELIKYVTKHWKTEIEPALEAKFGERKKVSGTSYPDRDAAIYQEHINRKSNGKTVKDIQIEYGLQRSQYYAIIRRQKDPMNS